MDLIQCPLMSVRSFPVTPERSFIQFWAVLQRLVERWDTTSASRHNSLSLQIIQCKCSPVKIQSRVWDPTGTGGHCRSADICTYAFGNIQWHKDVSWEDTEKCCPVPTILLGSLEQARILFVKCSADVRGGIQQSVLFTLEQRGFSWG